MHFEVVDSITLDWIYHRANVDCLFEGHLIMLCLHQYVFNFKVEQILNIEK